MVKVPTEEELQRLTPDERIKRLREIAEMNKKELEETRKQVEAELAAAEELISRSEDEKEEEEEAIEQAKERLRELQESEEESLEERLANAPKNAESAGVQYGQPSGLYNVLPTVADDLERLYNKKEWDREDVQHYNQAKEELQRVQQYHLTSEKLAEELDLGVNILNKLRYRT